MRLDLDRFCDRVIELHGGVVARTHEADGPDGVPATGAVPLAHRFCRASDARAHAQVSDGVGVLVGLRVHAHDHRDRRQLRSVLGWHGDLSPLVDFDAGTAVFRLHLCRSGGVVLPEKVAASRQREGERDHGNLPLVLGHAPCVPPPVGKTASFAGAVSGPVVLSSGAMAKDSLTVTDNRTGKSYELPITDDTIRAADLRQIRVEDGDFGLMAYDPAFMNTASCRSAITYIDGDKGILRYRGYPVDQLAEKSSYLE
jgi:hypothetical protein